MNAVSFYFQGKKKPPSNMNGGIKGHCKVV
ncbi:hypothetical protein MED121_10739 [Marinomonas sp. MED121]|nr:hypothetical protein MED121_10739 [Marinomonas sp. MED121]